MATRPWPTERHSGTRRWPAATKRRSAPRPSWRERRPRSPGARYRDIVTTPVSELFDPARWTSVEAFGDLTDITYHHDTSGRIARVAFNRPEVRNAFRPQTVDELYRVLDDARQNVRIGVVLITGNGPSPKDGGWAFCSGGDQRIRRRSGY